MFPSGSIEYVSAPARTATVGRSNRCASSGEKMTGVRPLVATMPEPSALVVSLADADAFSVMVFPVLRFVYECANEPVMRKTMDPSGVLRIFANSLLMDVIRTGNPQ